MSAVEFDRHTLLLAIESNEKRLTSKGTFRECTFTKDNYHARVIMKQIGLKYFTLSLVYCVFYMITTM